MDEKWGCIKHIGMSYDMYMRMPIDERREFIHRHNMEQMEKYYRVYAAFKAGLEEIDSHNLASIYIYIC